MLSSFFISLDYFRLNEIYHFTYTLRSTFMFLILWFRENDNPSNQKKKLCNENRPILSSSEVTFAIVFLLYSLFRQRKTHLTFRRLSIPKQYTTKIYYYDKSTDDTTNYKNFRSICAHDNCKFSNVVVSKKDEPSFWNFIRLICELM